MICLIVNVADRPILVRFDPFTANRFVAAYPAHWRAGRRNSPSTPWLNNNKKLSSDLLPTTREDSIIQGV